MNPEMLGKITAIKGVIGVTLTDPYGELLSSSIDDEKVNEFIAFLPGITPVIEEGLGLGVVSQVMLKGPQLDNLTIFIDKGQSLGVQSEPRGSMQVLSRQIKEVITS
ncbi:MAG: hypothetical protein KAH03_06530 [Cocleimonas sp.]|nr:hypothetical protein [Cocleimonas sp.]